MDTIVKYLYDTGYQGWAIILAVFLIFIEFNPKIKFNPIAKFLGWVGSKFNSSVKTQIEEYMKTINADMLTTKEEINLLGLLRLLGKVKMKIANLMKLNMI